MKTKLDENDIAMVIEDDQYTVLPDGRTTICQLMLKNGFTVVGVSSCVDSAHFNEERGRDIAYKNAIDQVWKFEGYLLKQRLYEVESAPKHLLLDTQGLDFSEALRALKRGKKVARDGWNGKGMWLSLSTSNDSHLASARVIHADSFWSQNNRAYAHQNGGFATVLPCITMKTATGEILMGWLASQTDMLANDWTIVE